MFKRLREKINKHILVKKAAKNSGWVIIQNISTMALGIFVTALVARYLGPERYGIFNYVLSVTGLFAGIASVGINNIIVKDLIDEPNNEGKILGTGFIIRLIASIILIVVSEIILCLLSGADKTMMIIGAILASMMIFKAFEVIEYYLQSKLNMKIVAIVKILVYAILCAVKILCIVFKLGLIFYSFAYLIETIVYAVAIYLAYIVIKKKTNTSYKWTFDKKYAKSLLGRSWYFALSAVMVTIYLRIDQTMLGTMIADKSEVGIYSAAVRITELWVFIPLAIITSLRPIIMGLKNTDDIKYKLNLSRLYYIISIICLTFSIFMILSSNLIVNILYGAEYIKAGSLLYILIFGTYFGMFGNIHYIWMICEKKQKYSLYYSFCGCASNIILNIILIPKYGGYGAAIATLTSQIIANVFSFSLFKETRQLTKNAIRAVFLLDFFIAIKQYLLLKRKKEN